MWTLKMPICSFGRQVKHLEAALNGLIIRLAKRQLGQVLQPLRPAGPADQCKSV